MRNKIIDSQKHQVFKIRMEGTRAAQSVMKLTEDKEKLEEKVVKEKKMRKNDEMFVKTFRRFFTSLLFKASS